MSGVEIGLRHKHLDERKIASGPEAGNRGQSRRFDYCGSARRSVYSSKKRKRTLGNFTVVIARGRCEANSADGRITIARRQDFVRLRSVPGKCRTVQFRKLWVTHEIGKYPARFASQRGGAPSPLGVVLPVVVNVSLLEPCHFHNIAAVNIDEEALNASYRAMIQASKSIVPPLAITFLSVSENKGGSWLPDPSFHTRPRAEKSRMIGRWLRRGDQGSALR